MMPEIHFVAAFSLKGFLIGGDFAKKSENRVD